MQPRKLGEEEKYSLVGYMERTDYYVLNVEDHTILIDVSIGTRNVEIAFMEKDFYMKYKRGNSYLFLDPWTHLVGFNNPRSALKVIGQAIIEIARVYQEKGYVPFFFPSDDRRKSIYTKLLKKFHIPYSMSEDEDGMWGIQLGDLSSLDG